VIAPGPEPGTRLAATPALASPQPHEAVDSRAHDPSTHELTIQRTNSPLFRLSGFGTL